MGSAHKADWTGTEADRRNQRMIVAWSLGWVLASLGADYGIENEVIASGAPTIAAIAAVTILGAGVILTYRRFLREADELMRKIQLDALALTVGVGIVAAFTYSLMEGAEIVEAAELMTLVMIMVVTYISGVIIGRRLYG